MKPQNKHDIQRRGELVGAFIRSGCKTEGVGTGISYLAQWIEFGGRPIGTGQDKSNLSSIISLQKYLRTDEPIILETIDALVACTEVNPQPTWVWLFHYVAEGSQMDKSRRCGLALTKYKEHLKVAENMLAARLA